MKHFKLVASSSQYRFRRAAVSGLGSMISIGPSFSRVSDTNSEDELRGDARAIGNDMKFTIERELVRSKSKLAG